MNWNYSFGRKFSKKIMKAFNITMTTCVTINISFSERKDLHYMKKTMAIELLPAKELKKQTEVPIDFSTLIQKALKYDKT